MINTSENNNLKLNEILNGETFRPMTSTQKTHSPKDEFKNYLDFLIEKEKIKPKQIIYLKQIKTQPKRLDPMRAILAKEFPVKK